MHCTYDTDGLPIRSPNGPPNLIINCHVSITVLIHPLNHGVLRVAVDVRFADSFLPFRKFIRHPWGVYDSRENRD